MRWLSILFIVVSACSASDPRARRLRDSSQPTTWLVNEQFLDTRAAGAASGTLATPGPGARTVVDTGSKLSINRGATLAGSGSAWGDPGLWYGGITRSAGLLLHAKWSVSAQKYFQVGWDNNQTGTGELYDARVFTLGGSSSLQVFAGGTTLGVTVGAYEVSTLYSTMIAARTAGQYFFIKGGAYNTYTLLYYSSIGNASTVYPGAIVFDATASVQSLKVPSSMVWLPSPLLKDTFTTWPTSDGLPSEMTADSKYGGGGNGLTWVNHTGSFQVVSNYLSAATKVGGFSRAYVSVSTPNYLITHKSKRNSATCVGIICRVKDDSRIEFLNYGNQFIVYKVINGTITGLATYLPTEVDFAPMVVIAEGTVFRFYYNNALLATLTVTDPELQTGTGCGVLTHNGETAQIQSTEVFARGTEGQYDQYLRRLE